MICIGPVIAFFGSHWKAWARIQERKGQTVVFIGGLTNRNRIAFEREFIRIADTLSA